LPWAIDTRAATPLCEQIASGVRRAIAGRERDVGDVAVAVIAAARRREAERPGA